MIRNCKNSSGVYSSYKELKKYEKKDLDYTIRYRVIKSKVGIMAIHGGGIEPMTDDIASDIAGNDYSFYAFVGLKKRNNRVLHITSTCFDEPMAMKFLKRVDTVVTIHGCHSSRDIINIGGLNGKLSNLIRQNLIQNNFKVGECQNSEISGKDRNNICNKCKDKGVQIEISGTLRERFEVLGKDSTYYKKFISTIRKAIKEYVKK